MDDQDQYDDHEVTGDDDVFPSTVIPLRQKHSLKRKRDVDAAWQSHFSSTVSPNIPPREALQWSALEPA